MKKRCLSNRLLFLQETPKRSKTNLKGDFNDNFNCNYVKEQSFFFIRGEWSPEKRITLPLSQTRTGQECLPRLAVFLCRLLSINIRPSDTNAISNRIIVIVTRWAQINHFKFMRAFVMSKKQKQKQTSPRLVPFVTCTLHSSKLIMSQGQIWLEFADKYFEFFAEMPWRAEYAQRLLWIDHFDLKFFLVKK